MSGMTACGGRALCLSGPQALRSSSTQRVFRTSTRSHTEGVRKISGRRHFHTTQLRTV